MVCLSQPARYVALGDHYRDFHQPDDGEVLALLAKAAGKDTSPAADTPIHRRR